MSFPPTRRLPRAGPRRRDPARGRRGRDARPDAPAGRARRSALRDRPPSCARRSASSRSAARPRSASPRPWGWRRPPAARAPRSLAALRADLAGARARAGRVAPDGDQSRLGARPLRRGDRRARRGRAGRAARGARAHSRGASTRTRSPAAARWGATAPSCCPRARACSRTATPARSRRAATARRSASCAPRTRDDPRIHVWVDETRPLLQGARLTAWELAEDGIPHTLIADVAAGQLFARGLVDAVVFGADRIARNGDAANKIGSYTLSVLAVAHGVPCYVVAPSSTIDHAIASGARDPDRGARRRRGRALRRAGARRPRAPRSRTPPSTSRPPPTSRRS